MDALANVYVIACHRIIQGIVHSLLRTISWNAIAVRRRRRYDPRPVRGGLVRRRLPAGLDVRSGGAYRPMKVCPYCRQTLPNKCLGCGEPLQQSAKGRPRKWCDRDSCARQRRRRSPQIKAEGMLPCAFCGFGLVGGTPVAYDQHGRPWAHQACLTDYALSRES